MPNDKSVLEPPGEENIEARQDADMSRYDDSEIEEIEIVEEYNPAIGDIERTSTNDEVSYLMNGLLQDIPTSSIRPLSERGETAAEIHQKAEQHHSEARPEQSQPKTEQDTERTAIVNKEPPAQPPEMVAPLEQTGLPTTADRIRWMAVVVLFSLPVLAIGLGLRLWEFSQQSAYMDEASQIITGRVFLEQGKIYGNALEWSYGSLLYPIMSGWFDSLGGLDAARSLSLIAGLVTILATIVLTLGLFKGRAKDWRKSRSDLALTSKPMIAALLAGLIVAVLPTAIGISRFATYDAVAAGFFAAGAAAFAWARRIAGEAQREGKKEILSIGLFVLSALFLFLAFLTKYVVALYFPLLCLLVLFTGSLRRKGLLSFVLPLVVACAAYYATFANSLNALLHFSGQYSDLKSDSWWSVYIWDRLDLIVLALVAYWGLRQAFRDGRVGASLLLWGGALALIIFQIATRADYDYWKHTVYLIIMFAPLAGWIWSDWRWWDDEGVATDNRVSRWWGKYKTGKGLGLGRSTINRLQTGLAGSEQTERPGSYSLILAIVVGLILLGIFWSAGAATKLVGHWPSVNDFTPEIAQASATAKTALIDDTGVLYYMYRQLDTDRIATPFSINYKGLSGDTAYRTALTDQYFDLIILDGGATPAGKHLAEVARPVLKASNAYKLILNRPLDSSNLTEAHSLEIYRRLSPGEQRDQAQAGATVLTPGKPVAPTTKAVTTAVATTTAATSPTAAPTTAATTTVAATTVAPTTVAIAKYPAIAAFDFSKGDEGWGGIGQTTGLEPGVAVASDDTYKLDGHTSLKFTPQLNGRMYGVGVKQNSKVSKITMDVFIPVDKADHPVQFGLFYLDQKWGWHDDGFLGKITPGQWNQVTMTLPAGETIQEFGLQLVGYSGSIYLNGVTVEP